MEHWTRVVTDQDDVIARFQALSGGLTAQAWEWRLNRGRWRLILPGVALAHSGAPTVRQLSFAAVLHAGRGAALSGDVALIAAGFKGLTLRACDVAIPSHRRVVGGRLLGGSTLITHRVAGLDRWRWSLRGLDILKPNAAVLHAMAWADSDQAAEWRLAASVQQRLTAVPTLRATLAQLPRLPRRALALAVLDDVELGAHAASELDFLRFCRHHRLPLPDALQLRVRAGSVRYLDARWQRQRVSLELDGAHHREVQQWNADLLRSLHLALAARGTGEQLIRLTRANLRHDGDVVAQLLRGLIA